MLRLSRLRNQLVISPIMTYITLYMCSDNPCPCPRQNNARHLWTSYHMKVANCESLATAYMCACVHQLQVSPPRIHIYTYSSREGPAFALIALSTLRVQNKSFSITRLAPWIHRMRVPHTELLLRADQWRAIFNGRDGAKGTRGI